MSELHGALRIESEFQQGSSEQGEARVKQLELQPEPA
jgi:hypothetical protein